MHTKSTKNHECKLQADSTCISNSNSHVQPTQPSSASFLLSYSSGAGWKEDFEKFKAEKERTREPVEAKVLNAVLSTSSTPYRYPPHNAPYPCA